MSLVLTRGHAKVLAIQQAKMWMQAGKEMFWRNFTGYTTPTAHETMRGNLQPNFAPGKIIQLLNAEAFGFEGKGGAKGGGDYYIIEVLNKITGMGVSNDAVVKGTGTVSTSDEVDLYINRKRKETIVKIGTMNQLRGGAWAIEAARLHGPQLMDWYQRWLSYYGVNWSLLRKYSWHVEGNHQPGDYNIGGAHHPNFYVAGANGPYPTWSGTDATYEANIAAKVASVGEGGGSAMSLDLLSKLSTACNEKRIEPCVIDGHVGYVMLLHNDQWDQLKRDPDFRNIMLRTASPKSEQIDVLKYNYKIVCENFHIFVGNAAAVEIHPHVGNAAWSTAVTGDNAAYLDYGPIDELQEADGNHYTKLDLTEPTINRTEDSSIDFVGSQSSNALHENSRHYRLGMILGQNALIGMQVEKPKFFRDEDDYENMKTMDIDGIEAYGRSDKLNSLTSPTTVENTSSMVFSTHSRRNYAE